MVGPSGDVRGVPVRQQLGRHPNHGRHDRAQALGQLLPQTASALGGRYDDQEMCEGLRAARIVLRARTQPVDNLVERLPARIKRLTAQTHRDTLLTPLMSMMRFTLLQYYIKTALATTRIFPCDRKTKFPEPSHQGIRELVGAEGFEPSAFCSRTRVPDSRIPFIFNGFRTSAVRLAPVWVTFWVTYPIALAQTT